MAKINNTELSEDLQVHKNAQEILLSKEPDEFMDFTKEEIYILRKSASVAQSEVKTKFALRTSINLISYILPVLTAGLYMRGSDYPMTIWDYLTLIVFGISGLVFSIFATSLIHSLFYPMSKPDIGISPRRKLLYIAIIVLIIPLLMIIIPRRY